MEIDVQKEPCIHISLNNKEFTSLFSLSRKLIEYKESNKDFNISENEYDLILWLDIIITGEHTEELEEDEL